jgi:hypothetical protein
VDVSTLLMHTIGAGFSFGPIRHRAIRR